MKTLQPVVWELADSNGSKSVYYCTSKDELKVLLHIFIMNYESIHVDELLNFKERKCLLIKLQTSCSHKLYLISSGKTVPNSHRRPFILNILL